MVGPTLAYQVLTLPAELAGSASLLAADGVAAVPLAVPIVGAIVLGALLWAARRNAVVGLLLVAVVGVFLLTVYAWRGASSHRTAAERAHSSAGAPDADVSVIDDQSQGGRAATVRTRLNENASLSELWDQLHRVRIDLDVEESAADEPPARDAPESAPESAAGRPGWVDQPAERVGDVYQMKLTAGPWKELADCHRELEAKLRVAVEHRIQQLAGSQTRIPHVRVPTLEKMGLGIDYVLRDLCTEEYIETHKSQSFEDMKNVHVLLEFTRESDARLLRHWQDYQRQQRVFAVALGAGGVLGVLSLIYGLLRLDTWTRGYYTKRLLLGVPAAIIAFVLFLMA